MLKDKFKNKKNLFILIAAVLAVIIAAGCVYYFSFGRYTTRSNYGQTSQFIQVSANEMSFQYSCPYMTSPEFKVQNDYKVTVYESTKDGTPVNRTAEIKSVKYNKQKTKNSKLAWITVTIKMGSNFKFNDKSVYKIEISQNSIKEMKDQYSVGKISFSVLCEKSSTDKFYFSKTDGIQASVKELKDVKYKFEEKDGKTYLVINIPNDAKFTRLNASMLSSEETGISLLVSPDAHDTIVRFYNSDITSGFFYKEGTEIKLSIEMKEKGILYAGQEYTVRLNKGLLTDKDGKTVSGDYWGKFTYVK